MTSYSFPRVKDKYDVLTTKQANERVFDAKGICEESRQMSQ